MLLLLTALTTALMAGFFYSWSCSVIPGLALLPNVAYLQTMQSINRAIQNPVFFAGFMGTAILLPLCVWKQWGGAGSGLLLAAAICYWIGVMGVTVFGNVPLNNMLDGAQLSATSQQRLAELRTAFEQPWVRLNTIRTGASIAALALVLLAMLRSSQQTSAIQ